MKEIVFTFQINGKEYPFSEDEMEEIKNQLNVYGEVKNNNPETLGGLFEGC